MSARKGIKRKIAEWLEANPTIELTGREIEDMYVAHGGAVKGDKYPKCRRGRVDELTIQRLISGLPLKLVRLGPGRAIYRRHVEKATFAYQPKTYWGKLTLHPSGLIAVDLVVRGTGPMPTITPDTTTI